MYSLTLWEKRKRTRRIACLANALRKTSYFTRPTCKTIFLRKQPSFSTHSMEEFNRESFWIGDPDNRAGYGYRSMHLDPFLNGYALLKLHGLRGCGQYISCSDRFVLLASILSRQKWYLKAEVNLHWDKMKTIDSDCSWTIQERST